MLGWRLPRRWPRTPAATQAEPWFSRQVSAESISETSTWRPTPVRARSTQRGLDAVGGEQPADEVDDRGPGLQRAPAGLAGDRHQPAHGLQQEVVAGQSGAPPRELPNAVTEHETSPGFTPRSVSPSRPHEPISPGRKDSISTSARSPSSRASSRSSGSREVERERALVAVQAEVVGRLAVVPRRSPGARVVAPVGALDLDDVGAEVAEQHRGQRAGEHAREVGDEDPVQRRHGRAH